MDGGNLAGFSFFILDDSRNTMEGSHIGGQQLLGYIVYGRRGNGQKGNRIFATTLNLGMLLPF